MTRKKRADSKTVVRPPMAMPDMIPDMPTNLARKALSTKPKKAGQWRYHNSRSTKNTRR